MKKKFVIAGGITAVIAVIGICWLKRPELLGNIGNSYIEKTTLTSGISFQGDAGRRIKFSYKSDIESGRLDMVLYNSEGDEVYKLDRAKELECFFTLGNKDTYTLAAECSDFIGKYQVKVYKAGW